MKTKYDKVSENGYFDYEENKDRLITVALKQWSDGELKVIDLEVSHLYWLSAKYALDGTFDEMMDKLCKLISKEFGGEIDVDWTDNRHLNDPRFSSKKDFENYLPQAV